jgi:hypothetical protein
VNWVKAPRDMSANMTQYRVNARNCEAKRVHIKPYVACEFAHVGVARQGSSKARFGVAVAVRRLVPAQAGVWRPYYGKLRSIPMSVRKRSAHGACGVFGQ